MLPSLPFVRRPLGRVLSLAAALALTASVAGAQVPTSYHAEFLGSAKLVSAMNDAGLVVGTGNIYQYPRAFVAGPGLPVTILKLPLGFLSSGATDINESGVIVGVISPYSTTAFYPQPCRWDPDGLGGWTPTRMDTLPGDNRGTADAINDLGEILGTSAYQSSNHVVLYTPTGPVDLPALAGLPARSINNDHVYVTSGARRVHLDTLQVENLGVPAGATGADAWVINASGQIAGDLSHAGNPGCPSQAALYTDGPGWAPVGNCGSSASSYDLNDLGDVLTMVDGAPWIQFVNGGNVRVEDLIVADSGHWTIDTNFDIALNNERQMALHATNGGQSGILLISPAPSVTCQADLGSGGPGGMHLSMCGGNLASGTTADILVTGALPNGSLLLLVGLAQSSVPFKGGTLVPVPWALGIQLPTDALGYAHVDGIPGGGGPFSAYMQAVQQDAGQAKGWSISNAVRVDFKP